MHLYQLARFTNQKKENIVFWLNQNGTFNPADKISKFNIDKDTVAKWMELAQETLHPDWLQENPENYLQKMLEDSKEKIKDAKSGGQIKTPPPPNEETLLTHKCTELNESENTITNYIEVQDQVRPENKRI